MSFANVSVTLDNGQLGQLSEFAEGVVGLVGTGASVADKIQVGEPRVVFSLAEAMLMGITEADNPAAYKHVRDFYSEAGAKKELYLMLVPDTMSQTDILDLTETSGAKKLVDYSQGKVRIVGTFYAPAAGYTPVLDDEFDGDVFTAITKGQELAEHYAGKHTPIRVVVEGRDFQGDAASAPNLKERTDNRVAVVAGGNTSDGVGAVGLYLGRLASVPVQRKPSRIKDGTVANTDNAYIGTAAVEDFGALEALHDKGYIVLRTLIGRAGYFWSGDSTCAPATDDYNTLSRGRVIDKAHMIAYGVYVNELDEEVLVEADGTLGAGLVETLETKMTSALKLQMTDAANVSSARTVIDKSQNIISLNKLQVGIRLIPVGYLTEIEILLGFENPAI